MIKVLTLLAVMVFCGPSWANEGPRSQFFQQFSDSFMELVEEGTPLASDEVARYPWPLQYLFNSLIAKDPDVERRAYSAECSPQLLEKKMLDPRLRPAHLQAALLRKYFEECESEAQTGVQNNIRHLIRTLAVRFQPQKHPFMQRVVFNLPQGIRLKGLLALKGDMKPRPLIVLRLGIYSSVEEFMAEKAFVIQLFEQGPFNMLILENMTSPDFIHNNLRISMGGYDEGIQNILIAKYLKDPRSQISRIVQSLHFLGISLGGHGVLFATYLNDANSVGGRSLIDSALLLCPVVDLKATFEHLNRGGFESSMVNFWSSVRLSGLQNRLADQPQSTEYLKSVVATIEKRYSGALTGVGGVRFPKEFKTPSDFWSLNSFAQFYKPGSVPIVSIVTKEDKAVPPQLNSYKLRGRGLPVVSLPSGQHCSLSSAYHWDLVTTMLNSYFLSQAKNFERHLISFPVEAKTNGDDEALKFVADFSDDGQSFVKILLSGPIEKQEINLPLSGFDFRFRNPNLDPVERTLLNRWLQQNIRFTRGQDSLNISWYH